MHTPDKDGVSLYDHLVQIQKQTGFKDPQLEPLTFPAGSIYLWNWFWELDKGRSGTGFGPAPLAYTEILAWSVLTHNNPTPFEIAVLKDMDSERLLVKKAK